MLSVYINFVRFWHWKMYNLCFEITVQRINNSEKVPMEMIRDA